MPITHVTGAEALDYVIAVLDTRGAEVRNV